MGNLRSTAAIRAHAGPAFLLFIGVSLAWSAIVFLTGGFVLSTSSGTLTSTDALRPLIAGSVAGIIYLSLRRQSWKRDIAAIVGWRWSPLIAGVCTLVALIYAIERGTFFGSGPDQAGYVSQADGWVRGQVTWVPPEWARRGQWHNALWSSAPVGYRPTKDGVIAPTYSPGYPLLMALFQLIGGRDAVFYVVPLFGAALIWTTYLLGVALYGEWAGAIAALLMLCSPTFIFWLVQPMSDIPATTLWTIALLLALRRRSAHAIGAGIVAAVAILIRPNIAPLAAVPALLLMAESSHRLKRLAVFVLPILPAVAMIAVLNTRWWGSPLSSGYGDNDVLFTAGHVVPNLRRYLAWLVDTQSPMIFAGLLAPLMARDAPERRRLLLVTVALPALVLSLYLPYLEFEYWPFLRFLLPAFPAVLVGLGTVLVNLTQRAWDARVALVVVAIVTVSIAMIEWRFASNIGALRVNNFRDPFAQATAFANTLPRNAILISTSFSGTLHFYSGRDVLRYDVVSPPEFDSALDSLRSQGHPVFSLVTTLKSTLSNANSAGLGRRLNSIRGEYRRLTTTQWQI